MSYFSPKISVIFSLVIFFSFIVVGSTLIAGENKPERFTKNPVIAEIESVPLYLTDIETKQINELRQQLHLSLELRLKKAAIEKLGEKHTKYRQIPEIKISDQDAKAFYEANNLEDRGSYEQLYPMIKQHLKQKAEVETINELYDQAIKEKLVVSFLEPPNEFLTRVPVETAYLRGNKQAKVMLLEFSDYQCPFCARVQPTISMLRTRYEKKVIFGYRHAPLPFHREADEAAIAAECAKDQGKFIEYHNIAFSNPTKLYPKDLKSYAEQLKIKDLDLFNQCLDEEKYRPRIERDLEAADEAGIRGAPGFVVGFYDKKNGFVTGEIISGAQPQSVFIETIEKYLEKSN